MGTKLLILILCTVFTHPAHPTVIAAATVDLSSDPTSALNQPTSFQRDLLNELSNQIGAILREITTASEISFYENDPPAGQNVTFTDDELGIGGILHLCDTVIDGLPDRVDAIKVSRDASKLEMRLTLKVKQLIIHGEYNIQAFTGAEESGTFSVKLLNVMVEGVVSMLADPYGNAVITKMVPNVYSEEAHVKIKSRVLQNDAVLKAALIHVENSVRNRLYRVANTHLVWRHPNEYDAESEVPESNLTVFEARKFVNRRYDPFQVTKASLRESSSVWQLGPFHLSGFSNIRVEETDMFVQDDVVSILVRIVVDGLSGKFPFTLRRRSVLGQCTVEKIEFLAKLKIFVDGSQTHPILDVLALDTTGCRAWVDDEAGRLSVIDEGFGSGANDLFCFFIKNEIISTYDIIKTVQADILNKVDINRFMPKINAVLYEERLLSDAY